METKQYNSLFSFIWNIANDVLVHAFEKGDYKKIILPFMVLRRIDVLLKSTKEKVLEKKEFCDKNGIVEYGPFLTGVTGYPFYNTSAFTMNTLKNEVDPQRLKMNVIEYFNGFSKDVQDIIDKFKLRQQVDNLTEVGRLGSLLEKFTDGNIDLSINPVMEETTDANGNVKVVVLNELPARIAKSADFVNAVKNGDKQAAQITFNDDIITIVAGMLEEKTEFVQTYFGNHDFQNFINAKVFSAVMNRLSDV